jgi:adenylate cyclase
MSPTIPVPFEQEDIKPRHKDIKLSKLRRLRDRELQPGEEYVRHNEQFRTVTTRHFNGRQIPVVAYERVAVVKAYQPESPTPWELKYIVRVGRLKITQLSNLVRRLVNRTTRLRTALAKPDHGFDERQVEALNYQFMVMAKQLEFAVTEAKGRIHADT